MDSKPKSNKGPLLLLVGLVAVGAIIAAAWNTGRLSAKEDEAFGPSCEAASETPSEASACLDRMKESYQGPQDDYRRMANASAQHVADYREGRR